MRRMKNSAMLAVSAVICVISVICAGIRLPVILAGKTNSTMLYATKFTLPDGSVMLENEKKTISSVSGNSQQTEGDAEQTVNTHETESPEDATRHEGEQKFPIIESQYGASGVKYDNFYVKNNTDYVINIAQQLNYSLGFKMEETTKPQVLIYHTHACESYMKKDTGFFYESFYPRSTDNSENVTAVGEKLTTRLNELGIGTIQDKTQHDEPSYNGAYYRSADTARSYIEEYPSIKVVIDIHRDSIASGEDNGKIKPTFVANGRKAAQIMIMSGYDPDGSLEFPQWEQNLRFALRLQQKAENLYPGMTRPLHFGEFVYNMDINPGSLLIEIGTDANTVAEAEYTGELLAEVLAEVLK